MPQLHFADFPPQLVWLAISFVVLYLLMARVALPRISEVLETRAERIRDDLDKAAALKSEAEAAMASYEKLRAEARAQALAMMRETSARLAEAAAARQAELAGALNAKTKEAEASIAKAKREATVSLKSVAAETARAAASRLVGLDIPVGEAERIAEQVLRERG